jgi:hypothetical protein
MELGFEPVACRNAVENILREPGSGASESLLSPRAVTDGGLVATQALLYPPAEPVLRIQAFDASGPPWPVKIRFDKSSAGEIAALVQWLTGRVDAAAAPFWLPERIVTELARPEPSPQTADMTPGARTGAYSATIPASFIGRRWDLMYFVEVVDRQGNGRIYPDLELETPTSSRV